MKKALLIIIIFLILPSLAMARPADPSRLPVVSPLLPPPAGSQLDYENTLNSPPQEGQEDPFEILREEGGNPSLKPQPEAVPAAVNEGSGKVWIWIVFLLATVVLFVYAFRAKKLFR